MYYVIGQTFYTCYCNKRSHRSLLESGIEVLIRSLWTRDPKFLGKLKKKSWYKHYDSLQQRVNLSVNEKDKDPESIGLK